MQCNAIHCILFYCIVLVWYGMVFVAYCIELYCTVLYFIVLYCMCIHIYIYYHISRAIISNPVSKHFASHPIGHILLFYSKSSASFKHVWLWQKKMNQMTCSAPFSSYSETLETGQELDILDPLVFSHCVTSQWVIAIACLCDVSCEWNLCMCISSAEFAEFTVLISRIHKVCICVRFLSMIPVGPYQERAKDAGCFATCAALAKHKWENWAEPDFTWLAKTTTSSFWGSHGSESLTNEGCVV